MPNLAWPLCTGPEDGREVFNRLARFEGVMLMRKLDALQPGVFSVSPWFIHLGLASGSIIPRVSARIAGRWRESPDRKGKRPPSANW